MENIFKRKITEIKIWIHGFNNSRHSSRDDWNYESISILLLKVSQNKILILRYEERK